MLRCVDFLETIFEEKAGGRHPLSKRDDVMLLYARVSTRCAKSIRDVLSPLIDKSQLVGEAAFEEVFNSRKDADEEDAVAVSVTLTLSLSCTQLDTSHFILHIHPFCSINQHPSLSPLHIQQHLSWRAWISSPDTLLLLAREHGDMGELTLAALFYDEFYDSLTGSKLKKHKQALSICLEATYNSASFQDIKTALVWAKRGFEIREHDARVSDTTASLTDSPLILFTFSRCLYLTHVYCLKGA